MNHRPRLDQILRAVDHRDDDYLWDNLLQLSSAYLLEDWDSPPLHQTLLRLKLPLAIFHGKDDGACRVECVLETQQAFRKAGQTNLTIHIYPKTNHDLDWTQFLKDGKPPAAFHDVFEYIQVQCQDPSR
jgi:alpha-beta hydrolase superfamily lysophospholipase